MADGIGGLLDDAWQGWGDWWGGKDRPTDAPYDAGTLAQARAASVGQLGGSLLSLAQGGLSPAQRAGILGGIGQSPLTYQQSLLAGIQGRLQGAQADKATQEVASQKAWDQSIADILKGRQAPGGASAMPGAPSVAMMNGATAPRTGAYASPIGDAARTALAALKGPESGGNPANKNAQGYSGLYQMGTGLANSAGLYKPAADEAVADSNGRAVNAWRGQWTIPGFEPMTHQQFLANPAAQEAAAGVAMDHNWGQIQREGLDKYVGQTVQGVQITPAALLQGAWLGGIKGLKTFVTSKGDPADYVNPKVTVSKWAALQPPGGAASDASGYAVPTAPAAGAPPGRPHSIADLSNEQLIMLRRLGPTEGARYMLEQSSKVDPYILTPAQVAAVPGLKQDGTTYKYTPGGGYSVMEEARTRLATPEEIAARPNVNPNYAYEIDGKGSWKQISAKPSRWATPAELTEMNRPPDAKVLIGPDGNVDEKFKGTDPYASLTEADAHGVLIRGAPAVKAGTLDPNSPEGLRYQAAYNLLSKGKYVDVQQPDLSVRQVYKPEPVNYPRLGAPPAAQEDIVTKPPPRLTSEQAKTEAYLRNMEAASGRLDKLTHEGGYIPKSWDKVAAFTPAAFANFLQTSEGKRYRQAQNDWTMAKLRDESGAVFGSSEISEQADLYFPRPGDDAEQIAQKKESRQTAMESMAIKAGRIGLTPGSGQPAGAVPEVKRGANDPHLFDEMVEINRRVQAGEIPYDTGVALAQKRGAPPGFIKPKAQ